MIAVGRHFLDPNRNMAEIAFVVHDEWQNKGISQILLRYLIRIARVNNFKGFYGEVLRNNPAMLHIIKKLDYNVPHLLYHRLHSFVEQRFLKLLLLFV